LSGQRAGERARSLVVSRAVAGGEDEDAGHRTRRAGRRRTRPSYRFDDAAPSQDDRRSVSSRERTV
jgi:hypothetical protein